MPDQTIPPAILSMGPGIPDDAWVQLSARRWRAEHPSGAAILALSALGTTISQGVRGDVDAERETWARLLAHAAEYAAHRMACEERTPIVRPDDEANRSRAGGRGVVGVCWWCGLLPEQHTGDPTVSVRTPDAPGDVAVLAEAGGVWLLRQVGDAIGSTGAHADDPDDAPPPRGIRSAEAAGLVVTGYRRAWVLEGCSHPDLSGDEVAR
jgi:hypothetical protein